MPKDYAALPVDHIRRQDRAVEDEAWIVQFLTSAAVGTLASAYEGQPFINSNLFVYHPARRCIYLHTAHAGRTRANIEANPRVCFSVMAMGRLLPADEALEFSVEYESVVVFGQAVIVTDADEALCGLQLLLDKYAPHLQPGVDYRPPVSEELDRTAVYRIDIDTWTGKRKAVAADFPGAFDYDVRGQPDKH
ncbi:MAG: pyridoxamine 5'-phosphate oxidase family protein [Anaerolineae bacterium]|nr:pyridoxamine 5'-phosphate oxidase family protein [Anaerolineae bacterium]